MKSFLIRIKGTLFASAQMQKMTSKMSENNHVVYGYGVVCNNPIELKTPPP